MSDKTSLKGTIMAKKMTDKQLSRFPPGPCVDCAEKFFDPNPCFADPICIVCKIQGTDEWTCRGGNWLCRKCSEIPFAVFHNNGTVGATCVGGPIDGERRVVKLDQIFAGYYITVQNHLYRTLYEFDWNLGFFVLEEKQIDINGYCDRCEQPVKHLEKSPEGLKWVMVCSLCNDILRLEMGLSFVDTDKGK